MFDSREDDDEFPEIEKELEDKLWELFYKMKKKRSPNNFSKLFFDV